MNSTDSINPSSSSKIEKAERAVEQSVERFESAMEGLASRVEDSSHRVQHSVDLANKTKDDLMRVKDSIRSATDPIVPYYRRVVGTSNRIVSRVQENPRPYLYTAAAFIGSILLIGYFQGRRNRSAMRSDTTLQGTLRGTQVNTIPDETSTIGYTLQT